MAAIADKKQRHLWNWSLDFHLYLIVLGGLTLKSIIQNYNLVFKHIQQITVNTVGCHTFVLFLPVLA